MATFLQFTSDTANASTYTFSSQNLGVADAERYIIVGIMSRVGGTGATTVDSVTIGGVSATISVQQVGTSDGNTCIAALAIAKVTTGTTGDVVVTFNTTMVRCGISVYRQLNITSTTAHDTDSSAADPSSVNLNVPANGHVVACSGSGDNTANCTWGELVQDHDTIVEDAMAMSSASNTYVASQTNLAMEANWDNAVDEVAVFASWAETVAAFTGGRKTLLGVGL